MHLKRYLSDIKYNSSIRPHDNLLGVSNDYDAVMSWLRNYNNPHTVKSYSIAIERFYMWLYRIRNKTFAQISYIDLLDYKNFLIEPDLLLCGKACSRKSPEWRPFVSGLSPSSIQNQCRILRIMFKYLYEAGYIQYNCGVLLKIRNKIDTYKHNNYLELNEYLTLGAHLNTSYGEKAIRYTFLFDVLFYTGLRRSEVANATQADIIFKMRDRGFWLRVVGKGDKYAEIPIPNALMTAIQRYREYWKLPSLPSPIESNIPLIIKSAKIKNKTIIYQKYTESAIYKIICRNYDLVAGICKNPELAFKLQKLNCHSLRHSYATALCDAGVELRIVKANMRHSNIETTMRYMHIDDSKRHQETQKFGAVSKLAV